MTDFINPYNFIPLSAKAKHDKTESGKMSGCITYSLLTKTPLFIPNTSNSDAFALGIDEHKSYDFFSYTDLSGETGSVEGKRNRPVIPGSEIRGLIRNNYEIITKSCISFMDGDVHVSKRTMEVFQPGLIKKEELGYTLYMAEDCLWRTEAANSRKDLYGEKIDWNKPEYYKKQSYVQDDILEGTKVYFNTETNRKKGKKIAINVTTTSGACKKDEGYIIKGEAGPATESRQNKHCCHIFMNTKKIIYKNIDISLLDKTLDSYQKVGDHNYSEYSKQFQLFKKDKQFINTYFPVYYSKISIKNDPDIIIMLSPSVYTREVSKATLNDKISKCRPCSNKDELCPACSLFGTINQKLVMHSRVRFTDLICKEPNADKWYYKEPVTLQELSSPKVNNMEFYFERPQDAVFWTCDYYIDKEGNIHKNESGINGRKFYWHNLKLFGDNKNQSGNNKNQSCDNENQLFWESIENTRKERDEDKIKQIKRRITVRLVDGSKDHGVLFTGKVYFENITKTELDKLVYTINAGEYVSSIEKKQHGYKLGAGKPLGLGSVALFVENVSIIKTDYDGHMNKLNRKESEYQINDQIVIDENLKQNFSKMTDFYAVSGTIRYPRVGDKEEIYVWFTHNHCGYNRKNHRHEPMINTRENMYYKQYLEPMNEKLVSTDYPIQSSRRSCVQPNLAAQTKGGKNKRSFTNEKKPGR